MCFSMVKPQFFWCPNFQILRYLHKTPKNLDTQKIAVIFLKLEQNHFTTDELA